MTQLLPKAPTIRDLARLAGLGKTTISDALRNDGRVTSKTRQRVHALARKIGYVPNTLAAALASSKTSKPVHALRIAFVTHMEDRAYNLHWFLPTQQRLAQLGYETDNFDLSQQDLSPVSLRRQLYHRGYKGVIFGELRTHRSELFGLDWSPFCVVCAFRTYYIPPFDLVRSNPFAAISTAWKEIRHRGYSRIGFLLCRHQVRMLDDLEREGALAVLQQDLTEKETAITPFLGDFGDVAAIKKWCRRHRPDVIVGFNSIHADLLRRIGIRIPRDIAYANLHNDETPSAFASIDAGDSQVPNICADYIDLLIRHNRMGSPQHPREILAPVSWIPGPSLPEKRTP
jgi:LacI family transcriptional regulator